jgi:hypothetical protein
MFVQPILLYFLIVSKDTKHEINSTLTQLYYLINHFTMPALYVAIALSLAKA